jgi:hypothetical protein
VVQTKLQKKDGKAERRTRKGKVTAMLRKGKNEQKKKLYNTIS